jgi:Zn-dependent protease/CBS domain-containing protein
MQSGFHLGRIFGINIRIDWSWIFVFFLITWNLGTGFTQIHEDWSFYLTWGLAFVAALLFFGSVLAHELAHSLMARVQGIPVRRITFFLFGGVSNIEQEPSSPRAEFLITIVGPITSFALGLTFIALSGVGIASVTTSMRDPSRVLSELSPLITMLLWLGPVNLMLGIFNLLPGFPLDGGRVLRSILWAVTDNLVRATRWASYVGQGMAWLMIGSGIAMAFGFRIPIFGTGFVNGLWLAFIGWFLQNASAASYRQVIVRDILEDVPVSRIMRANPPTVSADITISDLVTEIMNKDDHAFPVMKANQLIGIVTLQDMRSIARDTWNQKHVREIMTPKEDLMVIEPWMDSADALSNLMRRAVRQLPVVHDTRLVGLFRRRDIIRWLQLHADSMLS